MSGESQTPKKPRKSGRGAMNGNETGVPYSKENQPSPKAKSIGRQKAKFKRDAIRELLNLPYKFVPDSPIKKQLVSAFGNAILQMPVGEVMGLQQIQKAILKGDSQAFTAIMNQAFGMPKQEVETTERKIKVTRK